MYILSVQSIETLFLRFECVEFPHTYNLYNTEPKTSRAQGSMGCGEKGVANITHSHTYIFIHISLRVVSEYLSFSAVVW